MKEWMANMSSNFAQTIAINHDGIGGVDVFVCDGPWQTACSDPLNALEYKRAAYWHSAERNNLLAKIAQSCAECDLAALGNQGLLLTENQFPVPNHQFMTVALLVESPEHGRELAQRLPEWWFRHCVENQVDPHQGKVRRNMQLRTIDTLFFAHGCSIYDPDILIVAGSNWAPVLSSYSGCAHQRRRIVIDLADDCDERAQQETRRRLNAYRFRGWNVLAAPRWNLPEEPPRVQRSKEQR